MVSKKIVELPVTRGLIEAKLTRHLHHYTNGESFIGICTNKELWAGRPDQMNDSAEQLHAIDMMTSIVAARVTTKAHRNAAEKYFMESLGNIDIREICKKHQPPFTISLSEEGDLLSQWRAYCNRSGGYSLGLPTAHIAALANEQDYILGKCVYAYDDVVQIVNEIYDLHQNNFGLLVGGDPSRYEPVWEDVVSDFAKYLALYGTFIKHWSFEEEKEWRLVVAQRDVPRDQMAFTEGPDGVRVFHKFKISTDRNPAETLDPSIYLRVGPNSRPESASYPARMLLENLVGEGKAAIELADTTYR